jgi:hypothetical protein
VPIPKSKIVTPEELEDNYLRIKDTPNFSTPIPLPYINLTKTLLRPVAFNFFEKSISTYTISPNPSQRTS